MTYPETIEQKLDFCVIRDVLSQLCASTMGKRQVEEMKFLTDFATLQTLLQYTDEMIRLFLDASGGLPDGEMSDLSEPLHRIRIEGLYLDEAELFALTKLLRYAFVLEQFFSSLDGARFPLLSRLTIGAEGKLNVLPPTIDHVIDRYGQMRDNASKELARIRSELKSAQGSVNRSIQSILRNAQAEGWLDKDVSPTLREGRLVLPVPHAMRKKIGGIVHDESATGKTIYVEPPQVVEANNHIRSLESEERRERARILIEVTAVIRPLVPDIQRVGTYLGRVDFLRAKALLAQQLNAIVPKVENRPVIHLSEARHAVLYRNFLQQKKTVVPLTVHLDDENRILVISGPNAGGKSVCLKTVALLQYMLQCGLPIPVREDSLVGVFEHLMIDIGDEQSLMDDLSTYSSHLRNMKFFLQHATPRSLFLIDEFGSGTEPLIGGAIAEAILKQLCESLSLGIVTTHYTNLKHLAESQAGIQNGAMLYDRGALKPLFTLSVGQAGSSFAIEIARQIGLSEKIITAATEIVGAQHLDYDKQLQDIARDKRYWENKRQNIRQKEKRLEERVAFYEGEIAQLKEKKKEIVQEAKAEAAEILQQSNATIERTIREIKEAKADKEKTKLARQKVETMKERVKPEPSPKVLRTLSDLRVIAKTVPAASPTHVANTIHTKKIQFERTIDLRGMRADEALEKLIAYIDDAIMVAAGEVTILHGTGTGALKQLTREYLQQLNRRKVNGKIVTCPVVRFSDGDPDRGGAGLTIVEIL